MCDRRYTPTHKHSNTHTNIPCHGNGSTQTQTHTFTDANTQTLTDTNTIEDLHWHQVSMVHRYLPIIAREDLYTRCARKQKLKETQTQTHKHGDRQTHSDTQTCTHTPIYRVLLWHTLNYNIKLHLHLWTLTFNLIREGTELKSYSFDRGPLHIFSELSQPLALYNHVTWGLNFR